MEHEEGNFPVLYFIGETVGIDLTTASESGTIIACGGGRIGGLYCQFCAKMIA